MALSGNVVHLSRYPVKSMRGESLDAAVIGFQGILGDRMYAFVQDGRHGPFPWLTGRECPALLQCEPEWDAGESGRPRLLVATPGGERLHVESEGLRATIEALAGRRVHLHSDHRGNHDNAYVSIISTATVRAICEAAGVPADYRRFRMNVVADVGDEPFREAEWVGRPVQLGEARLIVTEQDKRCQMITLQPESGDCTPAVLEQAAKKNQLFAGVYASVAVGGRVAVGDELRVAD